MSDNVNSIQFNPDVKKSNKISALFIIKLLVFFGVMIAFYFGVQKISGYFVTSCSQGYKYDEVQKRCTIVCDASQFKDPDNPDGCMPCPTKGQVLRANGMCGINCTGDQTECGVGCIGPESKCINGSPCKNTKIIYPSYTGTGPLGNPQCCPAGLWANTGSTGCINTCPSGSTGCGESCCPNGQTCCNDVCCGSGETCTSKNVCCKTEWIRGSGMCCKNADGNGNCCPDDNIVVEGTGPNAKCYQECGEPGKKCLWDSSQSGDQICINRVLRKANGEWDKTISGCLDRPSCVMQGTVQFPTYVDRTYQPISTPGTNAIWLCSKTNPDGSVADESYPKATCKIGDINTYTRTAEAIKTDSGISASCNEGNCIDRFKTDEGIMKIETIFDNQTSFNKCKATYACLVSTGTKNDCRDCPLDSTKNEQCCFNENLRYAGLVCPNDSACYQSGSGYRCTKDVYSGLDTNFQCRYGHNLDTTRNKKYTPIGTPATGNTPASQGYKSAMEQCNEDLSPFRCNKDYLIKDASGKCYYYNPPRITNNSRCNRSDRYKSNTNYYKKNETIAGIDTEFQVCCEHSAEALHAVVNENTKKVPKGVYYAVGRDGDDYWCDDLVEDLPIEQQKRRTAADWVRCENPLGCNIKQNWYANNDNGTDNDELTGSSYPYNPLTGRR
jgi:hypothetical protein